VNILLAPEDAVADNGERLLSTFLPWAFWAE
jgi:hypothetical protein